MDAIDIEPVATPGLDNPVFIEGLPDVGLVGKLAVDHLIEELDSQPVRRVYSEHFPRPSPSMRRGQRRLPR